MSKTASPTTTTATATKKSARKPSASTAPATKKTSAKAPATKSATRASAKKSARSQPAVAAQTTAPAGDMAVLATESPWTDAELADVRQDLENEVVRLTQEISAAELDLADLLRDGGDGAGDDQADAGSRTFEREHEMSLTNNARDMLLQAERALSKISDGTYGICESCGNPIGKMRLQAFPRATLCMTCKQRQERR